MTDDAALGARIERIENSLVPFAPGAADSAQPSPQSALRERMAHYKIPGASIAVINGNGIEWAKGYGALVAGRDAPVTTASIFQAASTTKLLVSAIALHFVERGRFELDRDVNAYLRGWRVPESEFTRREKVTLRRLLTHRSGLNRPEGGFSCAEGRAPTLVQVLRGEGPATNLAAVIEFEPGSRWNYSNFDFVVIQLLLEEGLGRPLSEIAWETVFAPLRMASSTLVYPLSPELGAREARPHDGDGLPAAAQLHPTAVAQGGLLTTPSDLAALAVELIDARQGRSERLISPETARAMLHAEVPLDPALLGVPLGQGLGAFVGGEGRGAFFLHPGDNEPGATSWLVAYPELGQGVVIMTNGRLGNLLAMEIVAALAAEYGWPVE
ncbi:MAG: serine hydrolase domain-containing protein [Candidatus Krumholzibacteriia bacterium]